LNICFSSLNLKWLANQENTLRSHLPGRTGSTGNPIGFEATPSGERSSLLWRSWLQPRDCPAERFSHFWLCAIDHRR